VDKLLIVDLRAQLTRVIKERDELRIALVARAEPFADAGEEAASAVTCRFFFAAWKNGNRRCAELQLETVKLRKWLDESGREATRLQTERDVAREEIGLLTRKLAATEAACSEVQDELERTSEDS
jgi:septal ring factor EnvC (AmiA/AmiB activator)